jgi:hypothetical protein
MPSERDKARRWRIHESPFAVVGVGLLLQAVGVLVVGGVLGETNFTRCLAVAFMSAMAGFVMLAISRMLFRRFP